MAKRTTTSSKTSNDATIRLIKQILLVGIPLVIQLYKQIKPTNTADKRSTAGNEKPTRVTDRTPKLPDAAPPKATKRSTTAPLPAPPKARPAAKASAKFSPVGVAHGKQQSDVILTDTGVIVKILPDDNDGSRHQRFLVEIDHTDVTVKVSHNLDLAPRVPVEEGLAVKFKGEYEWNELGGAIHWTHHDPKQWRDGGWIEVRGKRYE